MISWIQRSEWKTGEKLGSWKPRYRDSCGQKIIIHTWYMWRRKPISTPGSSKGERGWIHPIRRTCSLQIHMNGSNYIYSYLLWLTWSMYLCTNPKPMISTISSPCMGFDVGLYASTLVIKAWESIFDIRSQVRDAMVNIVMSFLHSELKESMASLTRAKSLRERFSASTRQTIAWMHESLSKSCKQGPRGDPGSWISSPWILGVF